MVDVAVDVVAAATDDAAGVSVAVAATAVLVAAGDAAAVDVLDDGLKAFVGQSVALLLLRPVGGSITGFAASCCALSRSLSRTGRNASNKASTRFSVGPHREYPSLFCNHTTIVP